VKSLREKVRSQTEKRGEGGERARVIRFELGEGVGVSCYRWTFEIFRSQRLVGAQRLAPATQPEIADRAANEPLRADAPRRMSERAARRDRIEDR
jgi:hypothetical protein